MWQVYYRKRTRMQGTGAALRRMQNQLVLCRNGNGREKEKPGDVVNVEAEEGSIREAFGS